MHSLIAVLIPIIIVIAVGLIVLAIVERFSPDPLVNTIVKWVVFALILIVCITKLLPLIA
jgi:hypothetical protein